MPATVEKPVKVQMYYAQCGHTRLFESPSVEDPAGEFCGRAPDNDGTVRANTPGTCPASYVAPIGGRLFVLETLAMGVVSYVVSIEKQLEMTATEALYFEKQIQERMRLRRAG